MNALSWMEIGLDLLLNDRVLLGCNCAEVTSVKPFLLHEMSAVDQKEYLKKYLGLGSADEDKKKKKKKKQKHAVVAARLEELIH